MKDPKIYNPDLLHPELSHQIIGAAFDVHNELGPGWDEWDYHRAMLNALQIRGLNAASHSSKRLMHRNEPVDEFELDILVENRIVLELKHIRTGFAAQHYTQLINYLKCWEKDLGILINFGMERLSYKRVPHTPVSGEICFAGYWNSIESRWPDLAEKISLSCKNILELHGLGYGADSSNKILCRELAYQNLTSQVPEAAPSFNGIVFERRALNSILVDKNLLLSVTAFDDTTAMELARLRSGMKHLSVPSGVLLNFGKSKLTLRGVLL
jgi:GxxExxY protein